MSSWRFSSYDDGFGYGGSSTLGGSGWGSGWGTFRPGSRSEMLHRGRSGINRRYHNICLESEGFGESGGKLREDGMLRQTTAAALTGAPRNSFVSQRHSSTRSGQVPVRMEDFEMSTERGGGRGRGGGGGVHYESFRQSEVPYGSVDRRTSGQPSTHRQHFESRQSFSNSDRDGGSWQPVQVVSYSDSEPGAFNGSTSGETRHLVRETHHLPQQDLYYPPEPPRWRGGGGGGGGGQWESSYRQETSSRDDERPRTTVYETSSRRTLHPENSWNSPVANFSGSGGTSSFRSSDWNNNSSDIGRTRSFTDGHHSNRFGTSGSWDGAPTDNSLRYSTDYGGSRGGQRLSRRDGEKFRDLGNARSAVGFRQQPSDYSTDTWHGSSSARQTHLGPRSRNGSSYYHQSSSSSDFRPRARSMDRAYVRDGARHLSASGGTKSTATEDREFLGKVQKELENQRLNWQPEIDRLLRSTIVADGSQQAGGGGGRATPFEAVKNSYVDTSASVPVFKAYVDIRDYPRDAVSVNFDRLTNKVVVEASESQADGAVGQTFTQKIPLPRYADDNRLRARVNSSGVLRIEVPLFYYFPEDDASKKRSSKTPPLPPRSASAGGRGGSWGGGGRGGGGGGRAVEIVVQPGDDFSVDEIDTEVVDGELVVWGVRGKQRRVVERYALPPMADVDGIRQRLDASGCLVIRVPVE